MTFDAQAVYTELHAHFRGRIRRNESLSRHCTFGVGGPADVWIALDSRDELMSLVRLCAERRWPLLLVGNGTHTFYSDAGVRGIVARVVLNKYTIEEHGDGTALLLAEAGISWPRLLNELAPLGWGGLEFGPGIPGTLGGGVISNAGAHNSDMSQVLEWIEILDARSSSEEQYSITMMRRYMQDELNISYRHSRFRELRRVVFDEQGYPQPVPRGLIEPAEIILLLAIRLHHEDPQKLLEIIKVYNQHHKRSQQ